jgi:hypothetical protein
VHLLVISVFVFLNLFISSMRANTLCPIRITTHLVIVIIFEAPNVGSKSFFLCKVRDFPFGPCRCNVTHWTRFPYLCVACAVGKQQRFGGTCQSAGLAFCGAA